jgi:hypothetical protein
MFLYAKRKIHMHNNFKIWRKTLHLAHIHYSKSLRKLKIEGNFQSEKECSLKPIVNIFTNGEKLNTFSLTL